MRSMDGRYGRSVPAAPPTGNERSVRRDAKRAERVREKRLPGYLVAGNRFASAGLAAAVVGLVCSFLSSAQPAAWVSATMGVLLACVGVVKYCQGGATNRNAAVLAGLLAWLALVILLVRAVVDGPIPISGIP